MHLDDASFSCIFPSLMDEISTSLELHIVAAWIYIQTNVHCRERNVCNDLVNMFQGLPQEALSHSQYVETKKITPFVS